MNCNCVFYFPKHFISPPELSFDIQGKGAGKTWLNQAQVWAVQPPSQHLALVLQGFNPRHGRNQNEFFTLSCLYYKGRAETRQRSTETQMQFLEVSLCSPLLIKTTEGVVLTYITEFCQHGRGQSDTALCPTCSLCSLLPSPYLPCCVVRL